MNRTTKGFSKRCAAFLFAACVGFTAVPLPAATNSLTSLLQQGLFEEEANRNLDAAIASYQSLATQFDKDRQIAATAVFRLGECYRKLGRTNDAVTQYERIVRDFADQQSLATLSRQNLAGLGMAANARLMGDGTSPSTFSPSARSRQWDLLQQEIDLVEKRLAAQQKLVDQKLMSAGELEPTQRELLALKRQLIPLEDGAFTDPLAGGGGATLDNLQSQYALLKAQLEQARGETNNEVIVQLFREQKEFTDKLRMQSGLIPQQQQRVEQARTKGSPEEIAEAERTLKMRQERVEQARKQLFDYQELRLKILQSAIQQAGAGSKNQLVDLNVPVMDDEEKEIRRVQDVIRNSPDLMNSTQPGAKTYLRGAVNAGQLRLATFLLDHGADINLPSNGETPLNAAAGAGHKAMVDLLLSRGADVNATSGDYRRTALHTAVERGFLAVVETLLNHKADVNARKNSGETPLHHAAQGNFAEVAKLLIARGASVNARTLDGRTPLSEAVRQGHLACVNVLIAAKADMNALDGGGRTPLSLAADEGRVDVAAALLAAGADPNGGKVNLPLSAVIEAHSDYPKDSLVDLLLKKGADPNRVAPVQLRSKMFFSGNGTQQTDRVDASPIQLAVARGAIEIVKPLLDHKANPNVKGKYGLPLLSGAVIDFHPDIAKALLEHGADVNVQEQERGGQTPLHYAAGSGKSETVELLLAYKADVNAQDVEGVTPLVLVKRNASDLNMAQRGQWGDIAGLLFRHGAVNEMPKLDRIQVRRGDYSQGVLFKGATNWNRFTLFETIFNFYGNLGGERRPFSGGRLDGYVVVAEPEAMPFPDLARVVLVRPRNGTNMIRKEINLFDGPNRLDCTRDEPLEFGDVIEIPEQLHTLDTTKTGLTSEERRAFAKCLTGKVELIVGTQKSEIEILAGPSSLIGTRIGFSDVRKLLLSSSDLSRVKVTRHDPVTGKTQQWVLNCSNPGNLPDLWLRNGDVIEVPQK